MEPLAAGLVSGAGGLEPLAGIVPAKFQRALCADVLRRGLFPGGDGMVAAPRGAAGHRHRPEYILLSRAGLRWIHAGKNARVRRVDWPGPVFLSAHEFPETARRRTVRGDFILPGHQHRILAPQSRLRQDARGLDSSVDHRRSEFTFDLGIFPQHAPERRPLHRPVRRRDENDRARRIARGKNGRGARTGNRNGSRSGGGEGVSRMTGGGWRGTGLRPAAGRHVPWPPPRQPPPVTFQMKIGVISDTHGFLDPKVRDRFAGVGHILHAGDVGPDAIIRELEALAPVTAVSGNTDSSATFRRTEAITLAARQFLVHHIVDPYALKE